jgi:uncharacterized metal-binding protein YceD (DUF177 family)
LGKFDHYKIPLKSLTIGDHSFEYQLDSEFFKNIDGQEVQKGKVSAKVLVRNNSRSFDLSFVLQGMVKIPCDRCLDDMDLEIEHSDKLIVRFGQEYAEEGDDIIIVPESEGEINIAWFLYEFVALSIPIKHVHAPGKCNKAMSGKLRKHLAKGPDDESDLDIEEDLDETDSMVDFDDESQSTDPRWDELKKIIDNN